MISNLFASKRLLSSSLVPNPLEGQLIYNLDVMKPVITALDRGGEDAERLSSKTQKQKQIKLGWCGGTRL